MKLKARITPPDKSTQEITVKRPGKNGRRFYFNRLDYQTIAQAIINKFGAATIPWGSKLVIGLVSNKDRVVSRFECELGKAMPEFVQPKPREA